MKDGINVEISQGGCAHFSVSYRFRFVGKLGHKPYDRQKWIDKAIEISEKLLKLGVKVPGVKYIKMMSTAIANLSVYEDQTKLIMERGDGKGYRTNRLQVKRIDTKYIDIVIA